MATYTRRLIFFCSCLSVTGHSFLNLEELSRMQYGLEITNKPVILSYPPAGNVMYISSKHGQAYSCSLPEVVTDDDNSQEETFNLENIVKLIDESMSGACLFFNKGWWTYKVCHKKVIEQYHVGEKGKIEGAITVLGLYESEHKWTQKDIPEHKSRNLFHNHKYVNGSVCDLTSKHRETTIQYYCADQTKDSIIRVEEPSTCEYIITIHSTKLCSHPFFKIKEKSKRASLICSPALKEHQYSIYMTSEKIKAEKLSDANKKDEKLANAFQKMSGESKKEEPKRENIWKKTAEVASKFAQKLMDHIDLDKSGIKTVNFFDAENEEKTYKVETNSEEHDFDNSESSVLKESENLENDDGLEETSSVHQKLNDEFKNMKNTATTELDKSKALLGTLSNVLKIAKTEKERKSALELMSTLEKSIETFEKQIKLIDDKMNTVEQFEKVATEKIVDVYEKLKETKTLSKNKRRTTRNEDAISNIGKFLSNMVNKDPEKKLKKDEFERKFKNILRDFKDVLSPKGQKGMQHLRKGVAAEDSVNVNEPREEVDRIQQEEASKTDRGAENLGNEGDETKLTNNLGSLANILKKHIAKINDQMKEEVEEDGKKESFQVTDDTGELKNDNMKVRIRSLDDPRLVEELERDFDNLDETTRGELKSATEQMEEAVKKQLKEAGLDLQNDIKIKIITTKDNFDKFSDTKNAKILSDSDAKEFKDMLLGFLGGGQEKTKEEKRSKSLEENYNFVWTDENIVDQNENSKENDESVS